VKLKSPGPVTQTTRVAFDCAGGAQFLTQQSIQYERSMKIKMLSRGSPIGENFYEKNCRKLWMNWCGRHTCADNADSLRVNSAIFLINGHNVFTNSIFFLRKGFLITYY
jgi:hypothetical protein